VIETSVGTIVNTSQGTVRGAVIDGIHVFKGIPYAAPPFGVNHLRAPQPTEPWTGVRDVLVDGAKPPQPPFPGTENNPAPWDRAPVGEDCLNLNIYTPAADRAKLGVHTCPGGDCDSTHSADVDYAELLPSLFQLKVDNFFVALAGEPDRRRVLKSIRDHLRPGQRVFVGVIRTIDPRIETAQEVRDRVLEAAEYIPLDQLGTTDDCGFSPFCDDQSTTREKAFAKIRARVEGTALAAQVLSR
jgi:hypothetical protein